MNDQPQKEIPKIPAIPHLHVLNLIVALVAGIISIVGGVYSLKTNFFSPKEGNLQGIVRDARLAKPLKLASVEVSLAGDGSLVGTLTTDDGGQYFLNAIKEDNYTVKASAVLHKSETKTVKVQRGKTAVIDFELAPATEDPKSPAFAETSQRPSVPVLPGTAARSPPAYPAQPQSFSPQPAAVSNGMDSAAYPNSGSPFSGRGHRSRWNRSGSQGYAPADSFGQNTMGGANSSSSGSGNNQALMEVGAQVLQNLFAGKKQNSNS